MTDKTKKPDLSIQTNQVWTHVDGSRIHVTPESVLFSSDVRKLKNGATVKWVRFMDGWGIEAARAEGAAHIRTRVRFSQEAIDALMEEYGKVKDRPIIMEYEVHAVKPKKNKKKKK